MTDIYYEGGTESVYSSEEMIEPYSKMDCLEFSDDSSDSLKHRYLNHEYRKGEKGHYFIERIGKKGEKTYFEFYETSIFPRTTIRNAITGEKYSGYYVGSPDENLFFKVCNATGELKNKDPFILFYDNPEQWERHNNQICPSSIKEKWNTKFQNEMKKRKQPKFIHTLQEVEKLEHTIVK